MRWIYGRFTQNTLNPQRRIGSACSSGSALIVVICCVCVTIACGRKGPPLPPLLKRPTAPAEMKADRHGDVVDIQFTVPATNTDGTRPANLTRVDVYGLTATHAISEADVVKFGTKIASLAIKAPSDPGQTVEPDEAEDVEMRGSGLDQGVRAHVADRLTDQNRRPPDVTMAAKPQKRKPPPPAAAHGPLLAPVLPLATRVYVGMSVTTKGKNAASAHAVVSMIDTPPAPDAPNVSYDEKTVTVTWAPVHIGLATSAAATDGVLPSTPIGLSLSTIAYNVYEVSDTVPPVLTQLTTKPVREARLSDPRIVWGQRRCYAVRTFVTVEDVSLEGDESLPQCVTLTDTFPPAAPQGLQAVPSEGAISLIWDANTESDVRGYIVLRGPASAEKLEPLTTEPIQDTSFQDRTQAGVRFAYAVQAVDTAGNLSPPSARVEETAR